MGSWSKLLAPLFIEFVDVLGEVLDVGCGTGSLTFAAAENKGVSRIVGVDASAGFIEYARSRNVDGRVSFEVGDAQKLPFPDAFFDSCLSCLVVSFIPDASKAVKEMRRVSRPRGVVATCMWDNGGGMEGFQVIWNAAIAFDPGAEGYREKHLPFGSPDELSSLWRGSDLRNIEIREFVIPFKFGSFDDLWGPSVGGQGPTARAAVWDPAARRPALGAYLAALTETNRETLKERLRQNIFGSRPDGPFTLNAKAWVVRGIVPNGQ
jgi:SAM-dependent methyltransferase